MPRSKAEELILEETLKILFNDHPKWRNGRIAKNGLEVFNRLLFKSIWQVDPETYEELNIPKTKIRSYKEKRSILELRELQQSQTYAHKKIHETPFHGNEFPVIIAKYQGKERLLDGGKRINTWVRHGILGPHAVNFHEVVK